MADTTYSRWYREGSVTISQNSKTLQGANTYWLNANIKPGDLFTIDSSKFYEVDNVDSNTQITLRTAFEEAKITAGAYKIIRNFTATLAAETAAKVVEVLARNERYVNEDMKTVQGYSAYDLACQSGYVGTLEQWLASLTAYGVARSNGFSGSKEDWLTSLTAYGVAVSNGYTGTQEQWLESLKAAQEWTTLNERTEILTHHNALTHNSRPRAKSLGTLPTAAQLAAIKNGTFLDIYPGDYWEVPETEFTYTDNYTDPDNPQDITITERANKYIVMDLDYFFGNGTSGLGQQTYNNKHHAVLVPFYNLECVKDVPVNKTDDTTQGYDSCTFRSVGIPRVRKLYHQLFGKDHVIPHVTQLVNSINSEGACEFHWANAAGRGQNGLGIENVTDIELPSIRMLTEFDTDPMRKAIYNHFTLDRMFSYLRFFPGNFGNPYGTGGLSGARSLSTRTPYNTERYEVFSWTSVRGFSLNASQITTHCPYFTLG